MGVSLPQCSGTATPALCCGRAGGCCWLTFSRGACRASSTLGASRPRRVGLALAIESSMAASASGVSLESAAAAGSSAPGLAAGAGDALAASFGLGDGVWAKAPARQRQTVHSSRLAEQLPSQLPGGWFAATPRRRKSLCCWKPPLQEQGGRHAQLRVLVAMAGSGF